MNLHEIKRILDRVNLGTSELGFDSANDRLSNLNNFRKLVEAVEPIPIAPAEIKFLKDSFIFKVVGDVIIQKGGWQTYSAASDLLTKLRGLYELVSQIAPPQDTETISIKLPEERDFADVIKDLNVINIAITQNVINDRIGGIVVVKSWQHGSLWIDLYLGSVAAVTLVGGISWAAAVVRKKWHEGRVMEKIADSMDIKNDMLHDLRKGVKDHVKLVVESEAKNLLAHNFSEEENHDQIERLKHGIKTFADLIDRGAEVHPALQAPENVKNLFPDFTKLDLIESKQKLIVQKTDSNNGEQMAS